MTIAVSLLGGLGVISCTMVGPDFVRPVVPPQDSLGTMDLTAPTGAAGSGLDAAQRFGAQDWPTGKPWWHAFGVAKLDSLIEQALERSPTIEAAQAALVTARESATAQADNLLLPNVDASLGQNREKISTAAFGLPGNSPTFSLSTASLNVGYNLDLFGANRRQIEGLRAQGEVQQWMLQGARQTLAANIVVGAVHEAALRATLERTQSIATAQFALLQLQRQRAALGAISATEVENQQIQWAQAQAQLPGICQQLVQARHQLAVLGGLAPGQAETIPHFQLTDFTLPLQLPATLPSELVRQRPDILASEAQLHQATATLGMTMASLFPNLTLNASMGAVALNPGSVFNAASSVWSLGGQLTQPLFHGGALLAERRAAEAALRQAAANYRQTVLLAFQNVADSLHALQMDAQTLVAQTQAVEASTRMLHRARTQLELGSIGALDLLGVQVRAEQSQLDQAAAQANRLSDTAALFLALGGGWWNLPQPDQP